ncbi:SDR family oxidoreductase [Afifella sp. IM 167]|uniref:SDR family oxidoreductase n=1 Tax=Afifella sp. IM 167 TaxID=2033586 RepID=UPI001CC9B82F|nr:SDR family oxidoreductase [Afifella sp. IM 167]MBZ8134471.1 beta-D-hydroxybutyrate dehydrogenase [Afifella sp. IM 167]
MFADILKDRCALITGSAQGGLGHALAEAFAAAGANIVLNGLCEASEGEAAAAALAEKHGVAAVFDPADLRHEAEIGRMIGAASERFGAVDILVNNAVVRHFSPIEDFSPGNWEASVTVNLNAAFHAVRHALPGMKKRGWGRIINLSSYYGWRGAENRIDYVTTKTALIGMTRAIAVETGPSGVTCNAICPGSVPTPAIMKRIEGLARDKGESVEALSRDYASARSATGRFVEMEHVGALAVFLCTPPAADITGTVLPIDGGWLAK